MFWLVVIGLIGFWIWWANSADTAYASVSHLESSIDRKHTTTSTYTNAVVPSSKSLNDRIEASRAIDNSIVNTYTYTAPVVKTTSTVDTTTGNISSGSSNLHNIYNASEFKAPVKVTYKTNAHKLDAKAEMYTAKMKTGGFNANEDLINK